MNSFLLKVPKINQELHKILEAAKAGNLRDLKTLLTREKLVLVREKTSKSSILHLAVANQHYDTVIFLVEKFPHLQFCCDFENRTPLHIAAIQKNSKLYELLIFSGSNLFSMDNFKKSAFQYFNEKILNVEESTSRWREALGM